MTLLSDADQVVTIEKPHNRPPYLTSEEFAEIPSRLTVRVLKYRVEQKGFRSKEIELMTTLLDPKRYLAAALAELYFARWRVEINFRHIKQTMGMTTLRCKWVEGVKKELLMYMLVYNVVCLAMLQAAHQQDVPIQRISFIAVLRWLIHARRGLFPPRLKTNPDPATRRIRAQPRCVRENHPI